MKSVDGSALFGEAALYVFMQLHSSHVVTDPKGTVLIECGKLIDKEGYRTKVFNAINLRSQYTTILLSTYTAKRTF